MHSPSGAQPIVPAQSLLFERCPLGRRTYQRRVTRAVRFAKGMSTGDERDIKIPDPTHAQAGFHAMDKLVEEFTLGGQLRTDRDAHPLPARARRGDGVRRVPRAARLGAAAGSGTSDRSVLGRRARWVHLQLVPLSCAARLARRRGAGGDRAEALRGELIEKAAENDESLMEVFFEKGSLTEDEMRKGITMGLINCGIVPVVCISAKKDYGVARMMEFLSRVLPSPHEMPPVKDTAGTSVKVDSKGPASAFVFKSSLEPHIGEINYFKVMSGEFNEGTDIVNASTQAKERLSQIFAAAGKNRVKVPKITAGDIGATVKIKGTKTNHTLNVPNVSLKFNKIPFPEPKFRTAIKALNEADEEKLGEALARMNMEDPTIIVEYSKELKQVILHGQGEFHLNSIVKWHLDNIHKIDTTFIAPKIPYRETITKSAQADYRHKKQK